MMNKNYWNIEEVELKIKDAFSTNSETKLLDILKDNSFLFYHLYSRKGGIQPIFREISFGSKYRCDYAWLNDNSDGPEWVLVEVEKPQMRIFNKNGKPTSELNAAIEQVKSWQRYFHENVLEKNRIFGAVARFRFILVAGDKNDWDEEDAIKWRTYNNLKEDIEIRTTDVFLRALNDYKKNPDQFWSFDEYPKTLEAAKLENYWRKYGFMDQMRKIFT